MKRKDFLKRALITGTLGAIAPQWLKAEGDKDPNPDSNHRIGYNHLPNKEDLTMNTVIHRANTRGHANHGWLNSYHTFSFANYHNPQRMNFGVLRVLNDDRVMAGQGFGTHPHNNMEIISIPLAGDLEHKDSMGNVAVIKEGDVQVMSAGTGITHSEYNKNKDQEVKFLQIWLIPKKQNFEPRYDQISLKDIQKENAFYQVLSPNPDDQGVWVHQDAWFHLGKFDEGKSDSYSIKKSGNGIYAFVLEGDVSINNVQLNERDGMGVWDTEMLQLEANSNARVLLMEVPMNL